MPRSPSLFESIGAGMARIDAALRGFTHPAMHRVLQWDLRHAGLAREHAHLLPRARRARVERVFTHWETIEWARLPHGVIHNDANDNYAAHNRARNPDDAYQVVTEAGAWELLDVLEPYSLGAAFEVVRDACA